MSFWQDKKKPIIGLSPMDGVTDEPMRQISAKYGHPGVIFTEFVNVEYAVRQPGKILKRFFYSPIERPIVAQISGVTPSLFYQFAFLAAYLGFDGVDINMGCPSRTVTYHGGGAALIDNQKLAQELVLSARAGLEDWQAGKKVTSVVSSQDVLLEIEAINKKNQSLGAGRGSGQVGLSVKTRLGIKKACVNKWLGFLASLPLEAITVHGRVLEAGHSGPVDWEATALAAKIAHREGKILLGNGSVKSWSEAKKASGEYNLDGVLIGRGAMGNPWVFTDKVPIEDERLSVMMEHVRYYLDLFGNENFISLRKHLAWYARGFSGARRLRSRLVRANNLAEVKKIIKKFS